MVTSDRTDETAAVLNRLDLLERLCASPAQMRDLVDELGQARSTVNRAVNELEDVGLVERGEGGIRATVTGHFARDRLEAFLADFDDIVDTGAVLDPLSVESGLEYDVVAGGEGIPATDPTPYKPLERIHEDLGAATAYRALVPTLEDPRTVGALYEHVVTHGNPAEIVVTEAVFQTLREEFPRRTAGLAEENHFSVAVGMVPSYGLALLEISDGPGDETSSVVHVVVYGDHGGVAGVVVNESDRALQWANEHYEAVLEEATDRTDALVPNTDGGTRTLGHGPSPWIGDALSVSLERAGFLRLDETYFRDEPVASPATAWRVGLSLAEVHTGYAIDRPATDGDEDVTDVADGDEGATDVADGDEGATDAADGDEGATGATDGDGGVAAGDDDATDATVSNESTLTASIVTELDDGGGCVVVGPPGSGKSTICKRVASRWYESGRGPVFYREGDRGRTFDASDDLLDAVGAADGHALVVVEDAVRPDARAIFEAVDRLGNREDVSILLDSRESEWRNRPADLAGDQMALDVVVVPPMRALDCQRLVEHFERTAGRPVDVSADRLWAAVRTETATEDDGTSHGMLRAIHRLATYADPLSDGPTALEESVAVVYDELADDDVALSVCTLVNVLNAAGLGVNRGLCYAVADSAAFDAVDEALLRLEGRVLFRDGSDRLRTVHEEWSTAFLAHLVDVEGDSGASRRFGSVVSGLLALADDADRLDRIVESLDDPLALSAIVDDPGPWADEVAEAVFSMGQERSQLAPLFGDGQREPIALPAVCSGGIRDEQFVWLGETFLAGGHYDRAERAFERVRADDDFAGEGLLGLARVSFARSNYDETIERCRECLSLAADDDVLASRARIRLGEALHKRGAYEDAETHYRRALESFQSRDLARWTGETRLRLGELAFTTDEYDRARTHYEAALEILRELGDRRGEADALTNLGAIPWRRGAYDSARRLYEQSLEIRRRLGDRHGEAKMLYNLGLIHTAKGEYDDARQYLDRSVELYRDVGDRHGEAKSLQTLGIIAGRQGDPSARGLYERTLDIFQEIDAPQEEIVVRNNLVSLLREFGEYERARELSERSLTLAEELGDSRQRAISLKNLGVLLRELGEYDQAKERFEESLTLVESFGDRTLEARLDRNLGLVALRRGRFDRARSVLERSHDQHEAIENRRGEAKTLVDLGVLAVRLGEDDQARESLERGLDVAAAADEYEQTARSRCWLAEIESRAGFDERAAEHLDAAREVVEGSGYTVEARCVLSEARLAYRRDEYEEAETAVRRALEDYEEIGDPYWLAMSTRLLGRVVAARDARAEARAHFEAALDTFEDIGAVEDALETLEIPLEVGEFEPLDGADIESPDEKTLVNGLPEPYQHRARELLEGAPEEIRERNRRWLESPS